MADRLEMDKSCIHVGLTRDFLEKTSNPWEMGLSWLKSERSVKWSWFAEHYPEVQSHQYRDQDVIISWTPSWTAQSLIDTRQLLLIARWGVGYEHLDIEACTDAGVAVTITPEAVRRPVATANVAMILALSTGLMQKDRDTRAGIWQNNMLAMPGTGLAGKKLGSIGFGNIAKETFRLMEGFNMMYLAYSPHPNRQEAHQLKVQLTDFQSIIRDSDYLMINCPLKADTQHMIGEREFAVMKTSAFIINLSRGAIIKESALVEALQQQQIAGAGLDVFEQEPFMKEHPLAGMDQVILTPHALALTHDLFAGMERQHREMILGLCKGVVPAHVVNREVLQSPKFVKKFDRLLQRLGNCQVTSLHSEGSHRVT